MAGLATDFAVLGLSEPILKAVAAKGPPSEATIDLVSQGAGNFVTKFKTNKTKCLNDSVVQKRNISGIFYADQNL